MKNDSSQLAHLKMREALPSMPSTYLRSGGW